MLLTMLLTMGCRSLNAVAWRCLQLNRYRKIPYHNMYHAMNVMQSCYHLLTTTAVGEQFTMLEKFSFLIAALCHDIAHDGVNTGFHIAASSDLAHQYNDRSPLENLHAHQCFEVMRKEDCDILASFGAAEKKQARKLICDAIIGTDMAFHKKHVDDMAALHDVDMTDTHNREEMMSVLVHLCDIGASTFEWAESTRWARMISTEMHAQVELEKAYDVKPFSGYMDLDDDEAATATFAKGQVGFIGFVLLPFFSLFPPFIPVRLQ